VLDKVHSPVKESPITTTSIDCIEGFCSFKRTPVLFPVVAERRVLGIEARLRMLA